jgi:hypothetical protein
MSFLTQGRKKRGQCAVRVCRHPFRMMGQNCLGSQTPLLSARDGKAKPHHHLAEGLPAAPHCRSWPFWFSTAAGYTLAFFNLSGDRTLSLVRSCQPQRVRLSHHPVSCAPVLSLHLSRLTALLGQTTLRWDRSGGTGGSAAPLTWGSRPLIYRPPGLAIPALLGCWRHSGRGGQGAHLSLPPDLPQALSTRFAAG